MAAWSAAVSGPFELEATISEVNEVFLPWNGVVSSDAFWLGLVAGKKAELLDCVTFDNDGSVLIASGTAMSQIMIMNQRNRTTLRAIVLNIRPSFFYISSFLCLNNIITKGL
jgi:hypothetical protein